MDPEDALNVRKKIEAKGQSVVGWYHSHPTFEPEPSNIDIDNQFNYQKLFLEQGSEFEPFIGIIIGTFDIRLPTEESEINFFHVREIESIKRIPMLINHSIIQNPNLPEGIDSQIQSLIEKYTADSYRINLDDIWRYSSNLIDTTKIAPITKIEKLKKALIKFIPDDQVSSFLEKLQLHFDSWISKK